MLIMKKFSLFALAMCTGLAMFAQESTTPMAVKTRFGIKAGVNLAKLRINDAPSGYSYETNLKTSMNGGFFANIPLGTGGLAFQPEVLYSGQGSKITAKLPTTTVTYEQDMRYIAVPLMFQLKTPGGFYVELGPQAAWLINAKTEVNDTKTENTDSFDNFDVAAAGGIGYLSRIGLGINARYVHGLSNTVEDGGGNNSANNGIEMKNQVIQIGLSWSFGAGK